MVRKQNLSRRLMVRVAPFVSFAGIGAFAALDGSYILAGLLGIGAVVTGRRLLDRRENARRELLGRARQNRAELGRVAREDRIAASQMKRLVALQDGLLESWVPTCEKSTPASYMGLLRATTDRSALAGARPGSA